MENKKNINKVEELVEESLVKQDFMKEIFGSNFDYDIDFDDVVDTDMNRNPYRKEHLILTIEKVDQDVIQKLSSGELNLGNKITDWAKEYDMQNYFDSTYVNEDDNEIVIMFDVPGEKDKWDVDLEKLKDDGKEDNEKDEDDIKDKKTQPKNAQSEIIHFFEKLQDISSLSPKIIDVYIVELSTFLKNNIKENELSKAYVLLDIIEKISKEARTSIREQTIEHIEKTNDDVVFDSKLQVVETTLPNYSEDKMISVETKKLKAIESVIDARKKFILEQVKKDISEGTTPIIGYSTAKRITTYYGKAEDGVEIEGTEEVEEMDEMIEKHSETKKSKSKETKSKKEKSDITKTIEQELKSKYGIMLSDLDIEEEDLQKYKDISPRKMVESIAKDYDLIPISPEKSKHIETPKSGSYTCLLKNSKGETIGKYEVTYKDDEYAKTLLETIGVKLKIGDKIEFE